MIWTILFHVMLFSSVVNGVEEIQPELITTENNDYRGYLDKFKGFRCLAKGTNLKYSWKHNDIVIDADYLLKFPVTNSSTLEPLEANVDTNYEGFYQCYVTNKIGTIFGRRAIVKFTIVGRFLDRSAEVTRSVDIGKPFALDCPRHGTSQNVQYNWVYNQAGTPVPLPGSENYFVSENGTLYFSVLEENDYNFIFNNDGIMCQQQASVPGESSRILQSQKIKLSRTPGRTTPVNKKPEIKTTLSDETIFIGSVQLLLRCGAVGYPVPKLKWYSLISGKRTEITSDTPDFKLERFNQVLTIKNLAADKAGIYICVAKNTVGEAETTSRVKVAERPQWTPDGELHDVEPALYSRHEWKCAAFGGVSYRWYKNGHPLPDRSADGNEVIEEKNSMSYLIIKNVTTLHNGMYQCVASNELDQIYATGRLQVKEKKPEFTERMGPVTLIKSRSGIIVCPVFASPAPEITWRKNGQIVLRLGKSSGLNDKRYKLAANGRDLILPNVTDSDRGTYTCVAENKKGVAQDSSIVTVGADITWRNAPVDNRNVTVTLRHEIDCEADGDPSYEVNYRWLRNGLPLEYNARIQWIKDSHRLVILDALVSDTGTYTCIVSAETPLYIEKRRDAEIVVKAPADPPDFVWISRGSCWDGDAELAWRSGALNNEEVYEYWIDWSTSYDPTNWTRLPKVLEEETRIKVLALPFDLLPPFSQISFRITVFNRIGAGVPSVPTDPSDCVTKPAAPPFSPKMIMGVPKGPNTLELQWTPVPQTFWGAPAFNYSIQWRRKTRDENPNRWLSLPSAQDIRIFDGNKQSVTVKNPGYYNEWEFRIRSNNAKGSASKWTYNTSFSGQDPPEEMPTKLILDRVTARSADISWGKVLAPKNGSIDGYRLQYWHSAVGMDVAYNKHPNTRTKRAVPRALETRSSSEANVAHSRMKREDEDEDVEKEEPLDFCFNPDEPCEQDAPEKESQLRELLPYKVYHVRIAAFNSGGLGPWSDELIFQTAEAPPGPPYGVNTYPYDEYCKLTWKEPRNKNGEILEYEIYGRQIIRTRVPWWMRRHIIYGLETGQKYEAKIRARTRSGWGIPVFRWFQTHETRTLPAKPLIPEVVGYGEDGVNVTFMEPAPKILRKLGGILDKDPWNYREVGGYIMENLGVGGYPETFFVRYRLKGKPETVKETAQTQMWGPWDQTWIVIENLGRDTVYEFATVPVNELGNGPQSDWAQGLTGGIVPRIEKLHWYQRDWFIALIILFFASILLFFVIFCSTGHLKNIYYEGAPKKRKDRERERIYEPEDVDGGFNEFTLKSARSSRSGVTSRGDAPPPYNSVIGGSSRHSGDFDEDEDVTDSDDEKNEVSTYYSDEKKVPLDDLDDDDEEESRLATFV